MDKETTPVTCGTKKRWPLYASVALNCFLIGVLAQPLVGMSPRGPMMDGGGRQMMGPMRMEGGPAGFMIQRILQSLPQADAAKARAIFDDTHKDIREKRGLGRDAFLKVAEILKQDTPDLGAIDTVLDALNEEGRAVHEDMTKAVKRIATELSPESRRKIAAVIEEGPGDPPPPPFGRERGAHGRPMMEPGAGDRPAPQGGAGPDRP